MTDKFIFWKPGYKIEKAVEWQKAFTKLLNFTFLVTVTEEAPSGLFLT